MTALQAAELVVALEGDGPYTVSEPVNSAFGALGSETLDRLLDDANGDLLDEVLLYRVAPGHILSSDLSDGQTVTTLNGATFTVRLTGGPTLDTDGDGANDANIVATDVEESNGVIHFLEAVLLPPSGS